MHYILIFLANFIRLARKWLFLVVLFGGLVVLNLTTLLVGEVYDFMSQRLWGIVAQVSDVAAQKRPQSRAELEAEAKKARVDADSAKDELVRTRANLEAAESQNHRLKSNLELNERRLASLEVDAAQTIQNKRQINETVATLRGRITKSIRRDSSAEIAEMVPVLGAMFTMGSIAYDVNDACKQLEDLTALEHYLSGAEAISPQDEAICLKSFGQLVMMMTGEDPGYATCVNDRLNTGEIDPPSCASYDSALPQIRSIGDSHTAEMPDLPRIE